MFKLQTRVSIEDDHWYTVIDTNKSKSKSYTRYFWDDTQARDYARNVLELGEELFRVIPAEDDE